MRFLIVDDHPLMREALTSVLMRLRPESEVLQVATAADALVALGAGPAYDLVLLDLRLPDASGLDLLPTIGERRQPFQPVAFAAGAGRCRTFSGWR